MQNKNSTYLKNYILILLSILPLFSSAQHRLLLHWGWNRGYYTNSDIHFEGANYDFTLHNVVAKDRQSPFSVDVYFHPTKLSIPQTNGGITFFLNEHYSLALNIDHMKYVVQTNQNVLINGNINIADHGYQGSYNNDLINIQPDIFQMEHSDGLNYVVVEIARNDNLLRNIAGLHNKLELLLQEGAGLGLMIPRTDVQVLGLEKRNRYHLSGFGTSIHAGLQLICFKYFFLKYNFKAGYINLNNILTSVGKEDKAKQDFWFFQRSFQFGGAIYFR